MSEQGATMFQGDLYPVKCLPCPFQEGPFGRSCEARNEYENMSTLWLYHLNLDVCLERLL
jgi:hypothetical protein